MKKVLLTLSLIILTVAGYAQGIEDDFYNIDGSRTIVSDDYEFKNDQEVYMAYHIPAGEEKPQKYIVFDLEDSGEMEEGRTLLVKFADNSIMELKVSWDVFSKYEFFRNFRLKPVFRVTDEELNSLCTKNIIKLRFEQRDDLLDYEIKNDKLSKRLIKCVQDLNRALTKKRDLKSDF